MIGSVLTAAAQNATMFIAGHIVQGLCTSLLLIAAAPPLFLGFPSRQAAAHRGDHEHVHLRRGRARAADRRPAGLRDGWRPLFWIVAGISVAALVLTLLTFEDAPPADPTAPKDPLAIVLAAVGAGAAFFGASELLTHRVPQLPITSCR